MKRIHAFQLFVPSLYVEQAPIAHQSNTFYNILIGILLLLIGFYSYKNQLRGAQQQLKRKKRLETDN
ncbi:hypothetical protein GCM10028805_17540 [Spirosoma harenae]